MARITLLFTLLATINVLITQAVQETPTQSNATTEYYIFTASESSAPSRTIICGGTDLCVVKCSGELSCASSTISASGTSNLIVQCLNRYACRTLTISDGPTASADIECVSQFGYACGGSSSSYYSTFELRNTPAINILCDQVDTSDSNDGGSCYGLTLNAHNADTLSLECADYEDCKGADINADSVSTLIEVWAKGERALHSSTITAASANRLIVKCNAQYGCYDVTIYPPYDKEYAFSLTCANLAYSCYSLDVYIPSYQTFTDSWADLGCPPTSAISYSCDINWYCVDLPSSAKPTDMLFSSSNGRFQCETSNALCCPWSDYSTMTKLPTAPPTTEEPTVSPTESTTDPTAAPSQTTDNPSKRPTSSPNIPTPPPTKEPTAAPSADPSAAPTDSPTDAFIIGDAFPGYTLFIRGYNIWKLSTAGNALLDANYYSVNVESWTDEGSSCSLSSLEFDSSFSSYSDYASSASTSIEAGYSAGAGSAGGSMSKERSETKSYAASAQSYIYSLDLECSLSEASLSALNKLHWSSNFINNFRVLPDEFDSSDISDWTDFWDSFGTHLIKTAKLGGKVTGAITVDKCSVEESYSDSESYQVCLNAAYNGAEASGCHEESEGISTGQNAANSIANQRIVVKGGSTSVFTDVFNSFADKTNNFQVWIDGLDTEPDVIGGNLDEIHDAIRSAIALGNHNFNVVSDVDLTDDEWVAKADALEEAYEYYKAELIEDDSDFDTSCQLHCGEGTLDKTTCECGDCSEGGKCCGLNENAQARNAQISSAVMILLFVVAILR